MNELKTTTKEKTNMKKNEKTLIFFMDGIRPNQINLKFTPFLNKLRKKDSFLKMIPEISYSQGAHATIWSGLRGKNHNKFLIYYYLPNSKQFSWVKWISFIPGFLRKFLITLAKVPYFKIKKIYYNCPDWYKRIVNYPPAMPPELSNFFSSYAIVPKHKETIFSILDKEKITWFSQTDYNAAYLTKSKPKNVETFNSTKNQIDFYYFYYGDGIGHTKGPESKEMKEYLNKCDKKIKELYLESKKKYKKINYFIISDHGMCEINDFINIQKYLKKLPIKRGKDYLDFYDATMARFWTLNKNAEEILCKELKKIPKTTFLDKEDKKKYNLDFKSNMWGDLFLIMDEGVRPFPDYFAPLKTAIKAYHGYLPYVENNKGIFMTNSIKTNKKEIDIVDIMPSILKAISLEKEIPNNIDGKTIN